MARWLVLAGLVVAAWAVSALCAHSDQAYAAVRPVMPTATAGDKASTTSGSTVAAIASSESEGESEGECVNDALGDLLGDHDQPLTRTTDGLVNTLRPAGEYTHRLVRHVTDAVLTASEASRLGSGGVLAGPVRLLSAARRLTGDAPVAVLSSKILPRHLRQVAHWAGVDSPHAAPRQATAPRPAYVPRRAAAKPPAVPVSATLLGPTVSMRPGLTWHRHAGDHEAEVRRVRPHGHRQMARREPAPAGPFEPPSRSQNQGLPAPAGLGGGIGPASVVDQADWAVKPDVAAAISAATRQPIVRTIAGDRSFSPD